MKQWVVPVVGAIVASVLIGSGWMAADEPETPEEGKLQPLVEDEDFVELAPYMSDLQRYTHKMSLAAAAGNAEVAGFYMYEGTLLLEEIQKVVPEYRGHPIALLVDRMALPAYEPIKQVVETESASREDLVKAAKQVVASCNQCHAATAHGFIQITDGMDVNPFNQSFEPRP